MSTRSNLEEFDLMILGGGTGGMVAAWTFAGQGQRVAVIERKYIGGSCPNINFGVEWLTTGLRCDGP